jgi:hypothetical protein
MSMLPGQCRHIVGYPWQGRDGVIVSSWHCNQLPPALQPHGSAGSMAIDGIFGSRKRPEDRTCRDRDHGRQAGSGRAALS